MSENRYNMTLPQSFSEYNDEGSIIYRGDVEQMANSLRAEIFGIDVDTPVKEVVKEDDKKEKKERKAAKTYTKRRGFFLVVPIILSVIMLAVAVCGLFEVPFEKYISLYNYGENDELAFTYLDPAVSFISQKFSVSVGTLPTKFGTNFNLIGKDFLSAFVDYALPIATVLYLLLAIIMLIVAAVRLIEKKSPDGTYIKARLGFLSIMMFLCGLLTAISGLSLAGQGIGDVIGFMTDSAKLSAGYAWYAMIIVPVVTFICTCCAYGQGKKAAEEVEQ